MRTFLWLLLSLSLSFYNASAAVVYTSQETVHSLPVKKNKVVKKVKKKRLKKKRGKGILSPEYGKGFLIISIVFFSLGLVAGLLLAVFFPLYMLGFLIGLAVCFVMGVVSLVFALQYLGRNKNWDADYK